MGNFQKLLGRHKVEKKVDVGLNDTPKARNTDVKSSEQATVQTPTNTLVQDLLDSAQSAIQLTTDTINELTNSLSGIPAFDLLATELKLRAFDHSQLETNPDYDVPGRMSMGEMRVLQREVFETVTDIRAPFLWDLWNILNELTTLVWVSRRLWSSIFQKTPGNSDASTSSKNQRKAGRRSLFLDQEKVRQLKFEVERIRYKTPQTLNPSFVEALSTQISSDLQNAANNQSGLVETLKLIDTLLQDQLIELSENHQQFLSTVNEGYGSWRDYVAQKLHQLLPHMVLNTSADSILEFMGGLDNIAWREDTHSAEFRKQVEHSLFRYTQRVEDELLGKEIQVQSQARNMLHMNAEKAWMTKQFLDAVRSGTQHITGKTINADSASDILDLQASVSSVLQSSIDAFPSQPVRFHLPQSSNIDALKAKYNAQKT